MFRKKLYTDSHALYRTPEDMVSMLFRRGRKTLQNYSQLKTVSKMSPHVASVVSEDGMSVNFESSLTLCGTSGLIIVAHKVPKVHTFYEDKSF